MKSRIFRSYWLLSLIFVIALLLRTFNLSGIPTGIHGDEASIGYNAYTLLKTGHDQNGKFLPLSIDQFGDFRPPGYHYLDIPFVAILGLNEVSTRLPSAIFGALTIIVFYFLLFELFSNKKLALLGAGLLAISPWHIVISRATSEGVIAAFFIILGVYAFLKGYRKKQKTWPILTISLISFSLSFFFYHSARFFVPALMIPLIGILLLQHKIDKKKIIYSAGLFFLLLSVLFVLFTAGQADARPINISIFKPQMGTAELVQQIGEDGSQNPLITRFFHNKLFFYGRMFMTNYFQHFDGDFLFVHNGLPARYIVPWSGNLNLIDIPFLLFGFAVLLSEGIKNRRYLYLIPLAWLFIGAIPAGLTWEDIPNIQRSSLMLYALIAITAFGINEMLTITKGRTRIALGIISSFFIAYGALYFFHNYYYHSRIHEPWHRSAATKEVAFTAQELSKSYSTIRMTTQKENNLIHHLYYTKFDPEIFKQMGSPREKEDLHFGKLVFTGNHCPLNGDPAQNATVEEGTVYINMPECKLPKNAEIIKTINFPDGVPAYTVVKLNPSEKASHQ